MHDQISAIVAITGHGVNGAAKIRVESESPSGQFSPRRAIQIPAGEPAARPYPDATIVPRSLLATRYSLLA
jgi:hypothetical protein